MSWEFFREKSPDRVIESSGHRVIESSGHRVIVLQWPDGSMTRWPDVPKPSLFGTPKTAHPPIKGFNTLQPPPKQPFRNGSLFTHDEVIEPFHFYGRPC